MRLTSCLVRSHSYGPSCVWSTHKTEFLELCIPIVTHELSYPLSRAAGELGSPCLLPIRGNKAVASRQLRTTYLSYFPPSLLYDKNTSDMSTLQQIAFLLRNHGRWMTNRRGTMTFSTCCRELQCADPQETSMDHSPRVCVLT